MSDATCFVIMPYGVKKDADGNDVDFDEIYELLIREAVESVDGLRCVRCDDIEAPGLIHDRMVRHIADAEVAIVDTSTLNANVFYELGVRHALRRSVTVLIQKKGTTWPFNIAGLSSIEYDTGLAASKQAKTTIATFIRNALADPDAVDSLVHGVLDDLQVSYGAAAPSRRVLEKTVTEFAVVARPATRLGVVTGDRQFLDVGDIWVNSENTNMQMDRFFGRSTSATIRYLGAEKHAVSKRVTHDVIADELAAIMAGETEVEPATVIATGAGQLEPENGVRRIFHVASVIGQPREGYHPIERLERCVLNALDLADSSEHRALGLKSIVMPVLGTGPGGGDYEEHARLFVDAARRYVETTDTALEQIYFYAWSERHREILTAVLTAESGLAARVDT